MKCINEEKLWEYLDNEVDKITESQIEKHLEVCPNCQSELEQLMFFNTQFENAIKADLTQEKSKKCLVEIELSYSEIKPVLQKYWGQLTAFALLITLITTLFITLVCPVSGKPLFYAQFHTVTYSLSQLLYFMVKPIVMNIWVIVLTFSFLFWIDNRWKAMNRI